jgi:hypothetical protein
MKRAADEEKDFTILFIAFNDDPPAAGFPFAEIP